MMLQQFNSLSKENQQNVLLKKGTLLAERADGPFMVMLYQLDGFYVEVYCLSLYHKVAFLKVFNSTDALQPYLQDMDVSEMLNEVLS